MKGKKYRCRECGAIFSTWFGKCNDCNSFNTLDEILEESTNSRTGVNKAQAAQVVKLRDVNLLNLQKHATPLEEVNRVLGGGVVEGEVILLSGEPGVGKSTLVLNLISKFKTLYVAGEESVEQIASRAKRLGVDMQELQLTENANVDEVIAFISAHSKDFGLIVVDSIQTIYTKDIPSIAGSATQIKECLSRLVTIAKKYKIALLIIGHITKDGEIAGPKTLEHYVDCVLFLEGDRDGTHRLLRCFKNRFGTVEEVGVFSMTSSGLSENASPTSFLEGESLGEAGSALIAVNEGSRVFFHEIQALVVASVLPVPRRVVVGLDYNRVQLLLAIIKKFLKVNMDSYDVYVSLAGGVKTLTPMADAGIVVAILSSISGKSRSKKLVSLGEIGLLGEIKKPSSLVRIQKECARQGLELDLCEKVSQLK